MAWEVVPGVWKEIVTGGKGARPEFVKNTKVSRKRGKVYLLYFVIFLLRLKLLARCCYT